MRVVAGEVDRLLSVGCPVVLLTRGERGEVESGGPALATFDELFHRRKVQVRARGAQ